MRGRSQNDLLLPQEIWSKYRKANPGQDGENILLFSVSFHGIIEGVFKGTATAHEFCYQERLNRVYVTE